VRGDASPSGEGAARSAAGGVPRTRAKKPNLDEMGPGAHKESLPYRPGPGPGPGGGPRPRSTAGKGGTRAWRGKRR
jgi:hypothetical protein